MFSKYFSGRAIKTRNFVVKEWWLVVLGFSATLTAKVISWQSPKHWLSWLSHTNTITTFFPKTPPTFLICLSRDERQKYARNKVCLDLVSNSQPPGHDSDTLTIEPPRWMHGKGLNLWWYNKGLNSKQTRHLEKWYEQKTWHTSRRQVKTRGPWWSYIAHLSTK